MQDFAKIFLMRVTKAARRILKEFVIVAVVVVVVAVAVSVAVVPTSRSIRWSNGLGSAEVRGGDAAVAAVREGGGTGEAGGEGG